MTNETLKSAAVDLIIEGKYEQAARILSILQTESFTKDREIKQQSTLKPSQCEYATLMVYASLTTPIRRGMAYPYIFNCLFANGWIKDAERTKLYNGKEQWLTMVSGTIDRLTAHSKLEYVEPEKKKFRSIQITKIGLSYLEYLKARTFDISTTENDVIIAEIIDS